MRFTTIRKANMLSVLFLVLLGIIACEKFDENTVGKELLPGEDALGIGRTDTFTLVTTTLSADSIISDELSSNIIGSINDPVFGRTIAGMFAHTRLSTDNVVFDPADQLQVDSVVLSLAYSGSYYGDTSTAINFKVYEASRDYYYDSTYYSNTTVETLPTELNETNAPVSVLPNTRALVGNDTLPPQLRIRLKNELGKRILEAGTANLVSNKEFLNFFKGIYIVPDPAAANGVLTTINPISIYSKITIYYRNVVENDTTSFDLRITSASARFNTYVHDYSGTPVQMQLNGAQNGEQEVYIQSGGGTKVEIQLPSLNSLADSGIVAINKAELILPLVPGSNTVLSSHNRLLALSLTESGKKEVIIDQFEGDAHFDGFYNDMDKSYHLVITRYIQQVMNGTKGNYGIQIIAGNSGVTANRTILAGSKNATVKPKLVVTFTKP